MQAVSGHAASSSGNLAEPHRPPACVRESTFYMEYSTGATCLGMVEMDPCNAARQEALGVHMPNQLHNT